jgi:hypothetical protein
MKLKDIKTGDTLAYDRTLDEYRGSYKTYRGVVIQKRGLNIEVDIDGTSDWWYWPQIRHCNPRIESATQEGKLTK